MLDHLVGKAVPGTSALLDGADQSVHRIGELCGRPLGGDGHTPVGRLMQPPVAQPEPGRDVPGGGHWFDGLSGDGCGNRVVEKGDQREDHGGPAVIRHAVEVADFQPLPGAHRREQGGQVIFQVGDGGAAIAEQRPAVRPVGEGHPMRNGESAEASGVLTIITGALSA